MIYILIFVWQAYSSSAPTSALSVEFNSEPACQAAAKEIRRQEAKDNAVNLPLIVCAAKGAPPPNPRTEP